MQNVKQKIVIASLSGDGLLHLLFACENQFRRSPPPLQPSCARERKKIIFLKRKCSLCWSGDLINLDLNYTQISQKWKLSTRNTNNYKASPKQTIIELRNGHQPTTAEEKDIQYTSQLFWGGGVLVGVSILPPTVFINPLSQMSAHNR